MMPPRQPGRLKSPGKMDEGRCDRVYRSYLRVGGKTMTTPVAKRLRATREAHRRCPLSDFFFNLTYQDLNLLNIKN